tara:strand:+ start:5305 stop:5640 length:336 start_codon:yes stop_codon:yes gene_type:complete
MPKFDQSHFSLDINNTDDLELIGMFLDELPNRIDALQKTAESCDFSQLNRLAHQLKGAAPSFGFDPIGEAAACLEDRIKTSNIEKLELDHIRCEFDALVSECNSYLKYIDS